MTTIKLDPGAALLLDALHGAGHAAYAVGGCVRDSLLGLDPHDWDLCTSAAVFHIRSRSAVLLPLSLSVGARQKLGWKPKPSWMYSRPSTR